MFEQTYIEPAIAEDQEERNELSAAFTHIRPVQIAPDLSVGGRDVVMMAGPCSVESYEQTRATAEVIACMGGRVLRGGAFKPRTSPYDFQGLGREGLEILRAVADEFGLLVITEALAVDNIPLVAEYADIIQIGSRNMQHFPLLWAAGETDMPVLLKRGYMATIREWLAAATTSAVAATSESSFASVASAPSRRPHATRSTPTPSPC